MPVSLPPGSRPAIVHRPEEDVLAAGTRETVWRFEVLEPDESIIGELDGVDPDGGVDWDASGAIKGGGSITVTDVNQKIDGKPIDWLRARIRPVARITGIDRDIPCGIWIPAAPTSTWSAAGSTYEVELLDKASILDSDIWVDGDGEPGTFAAEAGATVVQIVRDLIASTGESVASIEDDPTTLNEAMVWEAGTPLLEMINDLLDAAGFDQLWCDMHGQFQVAKYVPPSQRSPMYEALAPFEHGPTSLMSPDFSIDRDIYSVPNRYIGITQGDGWSPALVSVATNTDPASPFSYDSRGRWITTVDTDVEAVDQQALDTIVGKRLIEATSVAATISIEHVFLPGLALGSVIQLRNPASDINVPAEVVSTSIPFNPTAMCSTNLQEVTSL